MQKIKWLLAFMAIAAQAKCQNIGAYPPYTFTNVDKSYLGLYDSLQTYNVASHTFKWSLGQLKAYLTASGFGTGSGTVTSVSAGYGTTFTTITTTGSVIADTSILVNKTGVQALTNKFMSGSTNTFFNIPNSALTNSTISGVSLGGTLFSHIAGYGMSGTSYTGTIARTWTTDTSCSTCPASKTWVTNSISGFGSGTVTSVGITGNNGIGVSGSPVTSSGSITLSLGTITPTSVNGITFSGSGNVANTGTTSLSSFTGSGTSSGTNTGDQTIGSLSPLTTKGDLFTYSTVNTRLAVGVTDGMILGVSSAAATGLVWSTPTYPMARGSAGVILRSDGTNNVYSTSTFADTYSANTVLYATSANTVSGLATTGTGSAVLAGSPTFSAGITLTGGISGATTIDGTIHAATTQFNNISTTAQTYRLTNGGANATPVALFGTGIANSGTMSFAVTATGVPIWLAGNGSRAIARGYIQALGLTNTAGSEAGSLAIFTQSAGAAATEKFRIGATGLWSLSTTAGADGQIPSVNSGATAMQWSAAPIVLSTTTGINAKATGTTTLYTVPSGKTAVITGAVIRCTAATSITVGPTLGIGVAANEDDMFASTALTALTTTAKIYGFSLVGMSVLGNAGDVVKTGIDAASTGTSQTIAIDLIGYLF